MLGCNEIPTLEDKSSLCNHGIMLEPRALRLSQIKDKIKMHPMELCLCRGEKI